MMNSHDKIKTPNGNVVLDKKTPQDYQKKTR